MQARFQARVGKRDPSTRCARSGFRLRALRSKGCAAKTRPLRPRSWFARDSAYQELTQPPAKRLKMPTRQPAGRRRY